MSLACEAGIKDDAGRHGLAITSALARALSTVMLDEDNKKCARSAVSHQGLRQRRGGWGISVHYKLGEKAMVIQNYWLASTPPKVGQTKSDFG